MATAEESSLCRQILGVAMQINTQGKFHAQVNYSGHVDSIEAWLTHKSGDPVDGWSCSDHTVYLGDFHKTPWTGAKSNEGAKQLSMLKKDLSSFVSVDEDGIPL